MSLQNKPLWLKDKFVLKSIKNQQMQRVHSLKLYLSILKAEHKFLFEKGSIPLPPPRPLREK